MPFYFMTDSKIRRLTEHEYFDTKINNEFQLTYYTHEIMLKIIAKSDVTKKTIRQGRG